MLSLVLVGVVSLATGFGLGRIKNKAKLAVVSTDIAKVESVVKADAATVVADIKKL